MSSAHQPGSGSGRGNVDSEYGDINTELQAGSTSLHHNLILKVVTRVSTSKNSSKGPALRAECIK